MAAEKGVWLVILLAAILAPEADGVRFSKELAMRAHFRKMGVISHYLNAQVEPVSESESAGNKSELQEEPDEGVFYQKIPPELHYVNRYPKVAKQFNVRQPPPLGSKEEYDEFCESWVSTDFKKHWGVAVRMTLADKDGERGLLCMINTKSHNAEGKYYIPLCFTRASELIRNASDQVREILSPYNITKSTAFNKELTDLARSSKWHYVPFPSELSLPIPEYYDLELPIMAGFNIYHIYNDITMILMTKRYWGLSMDPTKCRFELEQDGMNYGELAHQLYKQICSVTLVRKLKDWKRSAEKAPGKSRQPDFESTTVTRRPKLFFPLGWFNPLQDGFWPEAASYFLNIYYKVTFGVFRSCKDWTLVVNSMNYMYSLITAGLEPSLQNAEDIFSGKLQTPSPMAVSYWDSQDPSGSLKTKINVMYVDRLNEQVRRLHNSEDLIESLRDALKGKARFVNLDYENMTLSDQVQVSSLADVIVGVHGAGLTGSYWMKPGGLVVEIMSLIRHNQVQIRGGEMNCFKRPALIRGLGYNLSTAIIAHPDKNLETYNWMGDEYIIGQNASIPEVIDMVMSYVNQRIN